MVRPLLLLASAASSRAFQDMVDLASLAQEEPVVSDATSVELSEDGYAAVAALHSDADMQIFMQRVAQGQGLQVINEQHFKEVVPFYSGACATQSLEAMTQELHEGEKATKCKGPWLSKEGTFLRQSAPTDGIATKLYQWMFHPKMSTATAFHALESSLFGAEHIGMWAAIDETGYLAVATAGNPHEMFLFVRRVLKEEKLVVTRLSMLEKILPYYDGTCQIQSLSAMVAELHHAVNLGQSCFGGPWVQHAES